MNKEQILKRLAEIREMMDDDETRGDTSFVELEKEVRDLKSQLAEIEARERLETETIVEDETRQEEETEIREEDPEVREVVGENLSAEAEERRNDSEIRKAFANFVAGRISESEARSLGVEAGNGGITIPKSIATEVVTYAQEANLLRKYGTLKRTETDEQYPFLVKKAEANVRKKERGKEDKIEETEIEFDDVYLDPAEFDALATVTKKLLNRSGVDIEEVVIEELKKAYVRKETNYMFNGDDVGNENPGALAKKAVEFTPTSPVDLSSGQSLYDALIDLKNTPVTEVMNKGRFIINRAALTAIEKMKTDDGFPLLRPFKQAEGGIGHMLVGYPVDWTDAADGSDPSNPVFYFGDYKAFKIQEVIGSLEIQKLVEKYSDTNRVGFKIYNIVDGQLIYSPFEPAVYRFEIDSSAGGGGVEG